MSSKREFYLWFMLPFLAIISCAISIQNKTEKTIEQRVIALEYSMRVFESRIQTLNDSTYTGSFESKPVMFYATTKIQSFNLEKRSTVVFGNVIMNIGGHYNNFNVVFVSPTSGIYLFSWTACTNGNNYAFTELVVQNNSISRAEEFENTGNYHCGSMTALFKMNEDDHAWIRTTDYASGSKTHYFYTNMDATSNTFLGILVYED
ncbi:unnamed protein product [Mytilus coruscus]|uniref:C1q domain-containing protein n=1 Tax=Mytilus coruscus TaxID=42192 RepID=A0A6J8BCZ7_MYTCO|nr:unnamed protein product [Mytilus coruscus]